MAFSTPLEKSVWLLLVVTMATTAASLAVALPPWNLTGEGILLGFQGGDLGECNCLALTDAPLHSTVCGPETSRSSSGRLYRSLRIAPVHACDRVWTPLLADGEATGAAIVWSSATDDSTSQAATKRDIACSCELPVEELYQLSLTAALQSTEPSEGLLYCICNLASDCDRDVGCTIDRGTPSCGPFHIKLHYWIEASRVAGDWIGGSFWNCTLGADNMACSELTVRHYVSHYGYSCAKPGAPNDEVYARVHYGGPEGCRYRKTKFYWNLIKSCMQQADKKL